MKPTKKLPKRPRLTAHEIKIAALEEANCRIADNFTRLSSENMKLKRDVEECTTINLMLMRSLKDAQELLFVYRKGVK